MQRQRFRLEFEKHRGFLALEEQLQLRRLEEEERATLQRLRDSKDQLAQHSKALKELAEELEERCQRPALGLLEVRRPQEARPTEAEGMGTSLGMGHEGTQLSRTELSSTSLEGILRPNTGP